MSDEIVTGNTFNKYETQNPIYKLLMNRFLDRFIAQIAEEMPFRFLEVGCGEGFLASEIFSRRNVASYHGFDIDADLIEDANNRCRLAQFEVGSAYDLSNYSEMEFDCVIISEVMEHLEDTHKALQEISRLRAPRFIFSVPNEPIWRILNMMRLKYWSDFGNTPGHVQHWSRKSFGEVLSGYFQVDCSTTSFPWTIASCSK